ncbi:Ig-like domain-containing protein [Spirosoma sp. SC4-14]|uniref:beta strand repeat-containing protein n=1 Tax=Spirosoma sp. SC4-14 TaxID=3128900 RepID=UPI0030D3E50F
MEKLSDYLVRGAMLLLYASCAFCLLFASPPKAYAQSGSAACNTVTALTNPTFASLSVTSSQVAIVGGDAFSNKANLIDDDATFSTASTFSFLIGGSAWLEVKDLNATGGNVYPGGSFAGFVVDDNSLLAAVGTVTISTYLGSSNTAVETKTTGSLLATGILSGKSKVGFYTTSSFDRIRITYSGLVAGSLSVYAPLVERFCAGPALTCNTPTTPTAPTYPVFVDPINTGFSGVNVATISNQDNAISASTSDFASVNLLLSTGSASFAIKDQITDYPTGTFAGMDISSTNLLTAGVLNGLTISTYLNGTATGQSVTGASLVSVGSSLLSGTGRQVVGFIATAPFDEIKLTLSGVNAVGTTNIYGAVFESFCAGVDLTCNTLTPVTNPDQPVYVDGANTGIGALACVACSINNSQNVVDSDATNYATIDLTTGVAVSPTFAVANAVDTYPATTFAGFDIQTNTLLSANVLSTATITLYNNGSAVQTSTDNGLIIGATSSLLGSGFTRQIVGIVATVPFDEVKITFNQLVGADLGTIRIYNAIIQKNCATTLACNTTYSLNTPTFPVVINPKNTGVTGIVGASTTVQDAWNVVSASTTDFARITNTAGVAADATISVLDAVNTFPIGTFAGFTVKNVSGLVAADLFSRLTVTTYLDGTLQESRNAGNLLNLSVALFGSTSDFFNVGFVTTKQFDEIKLSVSPLVGLDVLGGSLDVYGAFIDTKTSTGGGLVCSITANPDFNVTNKGIPVSGNVSTNDTPVSGTTYGQPSGPASSPNGSTPSLTLTSTGSYTFTSATPGVYVYNVPICPPTSSTNCQTEPLTITVLDPTVTTNNPVANPDIAIVNGSDTTPSSATIKVTANDGPGNKGGTLGTPTIVTQPSHGTATVDGSGNVIYTPTPGYYGADTLTYQVCETPSGLCATADVTITVKDPAGANTTTVVDDYVSTTKGLLVTGNVKTNDSDAEGNNQTVTAQNVTVPGSGTLVLNSDGSFTFTPDPTFTGPVDFTYTTCDDGSPQACGNGTLHILVNPSGPDLTPIINLPSNNFTTSGANTVKNFTVGIYELVGQQTSSGNIVFTITVPFGYTLAFDNTSTSINVSGGSTTNVDNNKWTVTSNNGLQLTLTINAGQFIAANGFMNLGFTITRTVANSNSTANITVNVANDASETYDSNPVNNIYARNINAL